MSDKIAVDIALLPPEHIMDLAIELNREMLLENEDRIELDKKTCIPHVTLGMGIAEEKSLPDIEKRIEEIAKTTKPILLEVEKIGGARKSDGRFISGLDLKKTPELQMAHEVVRERIMPLLTFADASPSHFYAPPIIKDFEHLKSFKEMRSGKKYHPHITLGFGMPGKINLPIEFIASRIALCHLGKYSTCREILFETILIGE